MAKRTVIVCDVCGGGTDDNRWIATLQMGRNVYKGDICTGCVTASGWDLPEKKKRKQRNPGIGSGHEVTRLHSQKV